MAKPESTLAFDRFVGIDWSGARGRYKGVAVASCSHNASVSLVPPSSGRWSRTSVVDWMSDSVKRGERLLVGLDFAFGLPWSDEQGYLSGRASEVSTIVSLWDRIEEASAGAADFYAGPCLEDRSLAPSFWVRGKMPSWWEVGSKTRRWTEEECARATATHPVSVLKIAAASKQVGKGSLAGMRCLRALRARLGDRIAVWPFEAIAGRSVFVEIFPTLFRKAFADSSRKITARSELSRALARVGATLDDEVPSHFDDHEGDALISAAGLRWALETDPRPFAIPRAHAALIAREGMIFGMTTPAPPPAVSPPLSRVR